MEISFNPDKNARHLTDRGLSVDWAAEFDFETAVFSVDTQRDYGEIRHRALGLPDGRVHVLVFVETDTGIFVISFRKTNEREVRRNEQSAQP